MRQDYRSILPQMSAVLTKQLDFLEQHHNKSWYHLCVVLGRVDVSGLLLKPMWGNSQYLSALINRQSSM